MPRIILYLWFSSDTILLFLSNDRIFKKPNEENDIRKTAVRKSYFFPLVPGGFIIWEEGGGERANIVGQISFSSYFLT